MYLLGIGLVLLLMRWLEVGPVATLSWWWVALPFALAATWWAWADWTGYTKRRAMEREDERKRQRIERHREALSGRARPAQRRR